MAGELVARGCTIIGDDSDFIDEYAVMSTGVCSGAFAGVERSVRT